MKIKVIHLVEDLMRGGLENVIAEIVSGLDKEKYNFEVWCIARAGAVADELQSRGFTVETLGILSYHNPFNILRLISLLRKTKPDIVHTHGYFSSVIGRLSAKIAGVPVIINHLHTVFNLSSLRNVIVDKTLNLFTDRIICVSKKVEESFMAAGYGFKKKSIVIYNGIDGRKFMPRISGHQTKSLISVASLYPHKGQTYLLKALKIVSEECPEVSLEIVGDGPLRKELEDECSSLGISSKVKFLGERNDVAFLLSRAGIFILTSLREGFSLSLIEALACGLPVIATNIGGVPEIVKDQENGLLVSSQDSRALAIAIKSLLKDEPRMREMGLKGREIFEKFFTLEIMLKRFDELYKELFRRKCSKTS